MLPKTTFKKTLNIGVFALCIITMSLQAPLSVEELDATATLLQATIINLPPELHERVGLENFIESRISPYAQWSIEASVEDYALRVNKYVNLVRQAKHCLETNAGHNSGPDCQICFQTKRNAQEARTEHQIAAGYLATIFYQILKFLGYQNIQLQFPAKPGQSNLNHAKSNWNKGCSIAIKEYKRLLRSTQLECLKELQEHKRQQIEVEFAVGIEQIKTELEERSRQHKRFNWVKGNLAEGKCLICLENWKKNSEISATNCCGFVAHPDCFEGCHDKCPQCREKLQTTPVRP